MYRTFNYIKLTIKINQKNAKVKDDYKKCGLHKK